ncbi:C-C chemokine receptor type 5-like [Gastrophryne carolinensis]
MASPEFENGYKNNTCNGQKLLRLPQVIDGDCHMLNAVVAEIFSHLLYILTFTAIVANIVKIICTARSVQTWTASQIYLVNIALAHVIFLISCPVWAVYLSHIYDWPLGKTACSVVNFINALGHFGSILFICVICGDRMITICFPSTLSCYNNVTFGKVVAVISWALAVAVATLSYIFTTFHAYGQSKYFCGSMNIVNVPNPSTVRGLIMFLLPNIVIPTLVMLPCYARMVFYQCYHQPQLSYDTKKAIRLDFIYISTFLLLCLSSSYVLFVVCFVYYTSSGCQNECLWATVINLSNETARLLNACSALISPLIYMWGHRLASCVSLNDFSNGRHCSCHCFQQQPTEGIQAIKIVYISSVTDNPSNLKIHLVG